MGRQTREWWVKPATSHPNASISLARWRVLLHSTVASCFDKKRTSKTIVINIILFSMKLTCNNVHAMCVNKSGLHIQLAALLTECWLSSVVELSG